MSEYIEEAIAQAEKMLCPKGEPHTGDNNRAEHGHMECWVIGELLNEIERLRSALDAEGNESNLLMLEIERLRAENQMLNEALANKGTKQVAKIVSTTRSCDEWMLPIFAKNNRHLCDACGGEKYHHSYEWVPALTPLGGSYKPWSLEQIDKWREDDLISKERYHFLISVTEDFDKPKAVRGE